MVIGTICSLLIQYLFFDLYKQGNDFVLTLFGRLSLNVAFMFIGYLLYKNKCKYEEIVNKNKVIVIILLIAIGVSTSLLNGNVVDLRFGIMGNPILFIISSLSLTITILLIFKNVRCKYLEYFGRNSIYLFTTQNILITITSKLKVIMKFIPINIYGYAIGILLLYLIGMGIFIKIVTNTPFKYIYKPIKEN